MNEASFTLFQNTVGGIGILLYACCLVAFFYPFMAGRNGRKALKLFIVFLAYAAVYFMNFAVNVSGWVCMTAVTALLTMASGYLGIGRKFSFVLGVQFFSIRNLCVLAAASVKFYTGKYFV